VVVGKVQIVKPIGAMSYISNIEEGSFEGGLGCGPACKCGPCKSGMSGLDEWYEKETADEPAEVPTPKAPSQSEPRSEASPQSKSLKGWIPSGIGLGYYGQPGPGGPEVGPQTSSSVEQRLVQDAVRRGTRNSRQLSNIIFFARHPSRRGSPILANEGGLIAEWRQIREHIVLPALRQMFGPTNGVVERRRVGRPRPLGSPRFGFGEPPAAPVCASARNDLAAVANDLNLINNELAKGIFLSSPVRLALKKQLLDSDANGMIAALDTYIASGCCEPALKTLETEVQALPWPASVGPTKAKLLKEIVAAQGRARKDFKHC
jgi:hypothetical protein